MRATLRIYREVLEREMWPDKRCRVRIVGASWDPGTSSVVLELEGKILPDGGEVKLLTRRSTETEFRAL
ncbi:hypothetical protein C8D77_111107 [Mesorhizobium loti]|uniref:Uncharacterized protein n=1 Tax=Rhizobium loti TaxID=381 RepID=A0A8E2W8B1_RHILI|nr:hypothetical protein [Mesorhizobium loti]PWJ88384.1 hypothetical protein C8D77_111107 [Mesorhizobium loti]